MNRCLSLLALCLVLFSAQAAEPVLSSGVNTPDDHYKLAPGDRVSFRILEDKDESRVLGVTDSGEMDIPYVGRMAVTGLTCKDVVDKVTPLLEKTYYYKATVIVGIESMKKRFLGQVMVVGQVKKEGPVELPEKGLLTVSKAVLLAGGFADFAERHKVRVFRQVTDAGGHETKKTFEVDLVDVLEKGHADADIVLQPDDLVVISKRLINF